LILEGEILDTVGSHRRDPNKCSPFLPISGGVLAARRTNKAMASARIKLDPELVDAIARRVVELLEKRGIQQRELVDAAELARRLGIERSWVYSHAIELGAVKLGRGRKPRLRFDPEIATRVLQKVGERPADDPPTRLGVRADRPRVGGASKIPLLPVRGPDNGPRPVA
jgi:hypothetical protein